MLWMCASACSELLQRNGSTQQQLRGQGTQRHAFEELRPGQPVGVQSEGAHVPASPGCGALGARIFLLLMNLTRGFGTGRWRVEGRR